MKKIACAAIIITMLCCVHAKAQQDKLLQQRDYSIIKLTPPQLTYLYNQNHVDVYEATPDNMRVIKPDSSNHFTMPVAGEMRIIKMPQTEHKNNQ